MGRIAQYLNFMWIVIGLIGLCVIVPLCMRISGTDSTYCVMYYNVHREFTGSRDECERWIETKIKTEKQSLEQQVKESFSLEENSIPNISVELQQLERNIRETYKIVRLN